MAEVGPAVSLEPLRDSESEAAETPCESEQLGVDKDPRKLEMLNSGRSPIHEPWLDPLFESGLVGERPEAGNGATASGQNRHLLQ